MPMPESPVWAGLRARRNRLIWAKSLKTVWHIAHSECLFWGDRVI